MVDISEQYLLAIELLSVLDSVVVEARGAIIIPSLERHTTMRPYVDDMAQVVNLHAAARKAMSAVLRHDLSAQSVDTFYMLASTGCQKAVSGLDFVMKRRGSTTNSPTSASTSSPFSKTSNGDWADQ